jgi:hypothetical protein
MANPTGESNGEVLRLDFDCRLSSTTKPAFPALDAPASPALVHGRPCVEELALPQSVEIGNVSLNKAVIRWIYV